MRRTWNVLLVAGLALAAFAVFALCFFPWDALTVAAVERVSAKSSLRVSCREVRSLAPMPGSVLTGAQLGDDYGRLWTADEVRLEPAWSELLQGRPGLRVTILRGGERLQVVAVPRSGVLRLQAVLQNVRLGGQPVFARLGVPELNGAVSGSLHSSIGMGRAQQGKDLHAQGNLQVSQLALPVESSLLRKKILQTQNVQAEFEYEAGNIAVRNLRLGPGDISGKVNVTFTRASSLPQSTLAIKGSITADPAAVNADAVPLASLADGIRNHTEVPVDFTATLTQLRWLR